MAYFTHNRVTITLSFLIGGSMCFLFSTCAPPPPPPRPIDATFLDLEARKTDPDFKKAYDTYNQVIRAAVDSTKKRGDVALPYELVRIPVVVHIIQNGTAPAIDKKQVEQQIASLTRDFRRADSSRINQLPEAFRLLAADTRIEFVLAKSTPNGEATDGILYRQSTVPAFKFSPLANNPQARNPVKFTAKGGSNAWPAQYFLNIWVCNLDSAGRGYASLPVDLATRSVEDGIVVNAEDFGKPRTLTNLAAKWLGLNDIWGMGKTVGDDEVGDTPIQKTSNTDDCPTYPHNNRKESPYGDMYPNFMDATNDNCRTMFTAGQADRMNAVVENYRVELVESQYLTPPAAPPCQGLADYYIKDFTGDMGYQPSGTGPFYNSPSIRTHYGPGCSALHINPFPLGSPTRFVSVLVNYRCGTNPTSDSVFAYFAPASTVLSWNSNDWVQVVGYPSVLAQQLIAPIVGWDRCFVFRWDNPITPGTSYSIVASITKLCTLCPPENLADYVRYHNNTACNTLLIVPSAIPDSLSRAVSINVTLPTNIRSDTRLRFSKILNEASVLAFGPLAVSNDSLIYYWKKSGQKGDGVSLNQNQILILKDSAYIDLDLPTGTSLPVTFHFKRTPQTSNQRNIYALNLEQFSAPNTPYQRLEGGGVFVLKTEHTQDFPPEPQGPITFFDLDGKLLLGLASILGLLAFVWLRRTKK